MTRPPFLSRISPFWFSLALVVLAGLILFAFFGNVVRGYIDTPSVFFWWATQWFIGDDGGESEHGPIMLAFALLILTRNLLGMPSRKGALLPPHWQYTLIGLGLVYATYFTVDSEPVREVLGAVTARSIAVWSLLFLIGGGIFTLWKNRERIRELETAPSPALGLALLCASFVLHFLGIRLQLTHVSILATLVFIVGAAYLLGGRRWGGSMVFPAILMVLAIPLGALTNEVGFYLRMWVLDVVVPLSHATGIEVIRDGSTLSAPDASFQYDMAPACSGLRSLMALLSLSLVIGYLSFERLWRRLIFLVLAAPFAYLGNVLRIFLIIVGGEWFGQEAGNQVHDYGNYLVFVTVIGMALLTAWGLQKLLPEKAEDTAIAGGGGAARPPDAGRRLLPLAGAVAAVALVTAIGVGFSSYGLSGSRSGLHLSANGIDPVPLPNSVGLDWFGKETPISAAEEEILPDDTGFSRKQYFNLDDRRKQVFISIVLSGRDRSSIHRPEVCLVGQGWTQLGSYAHTFDIPAMEGGALEVTVLEIERTLRDTNGQVIRDAEGNEVKWPSIFAYWFVGADRLASTHLERVLGGALDRLISNDSHRWAYVIAQSDFYYDSREEAFARIEEVLQELVPQFQKVGFRESGEGPSELLTEASRNPVSGAASETGTP